MTDETDTPKINLPQFSVSEISHAIKNTMEGAFSYVRVRGELGCVTVAKSGHMYTDLKDDKSVLNAICWKGQMAKLSVKPEEGMDVICTGRITTYPGRSNYQLIIESMELAGEGALLKLLEERKKKLAAEGLFDEARKKPLPFLPEVIGVVTSPTGAVIRDIMHRLYDRFPRHVLLWPVMVQGDGTVKQVCEALKGFNALEAGGDVPRPDVLIVARGGGSLEDLMPFNEEAIVRAVADSDIPVISAIGHETDTTLIDLVADKRAPTPTGAAEIAVPVRAELSMRLDNNDKRLRHAMHRMLTQHTTHVEGLRRGLTDPARLLEQVSQRFDYSCGRLDDALRRMADLGKARLDRAAAGLVHPKARLGEAERRLNEWINRLDPAYTRHVKHLTDRLMSHAALLKSYSYHGVLERGFVLVTGDDGAPITRAVDTSDGQCVTLTFADDTRAAVMGDGGGAGGAMPKPAKKKKPEAKKEPKKEQGSLF